MDAAPGRSAIATEVLVSKDFAVRHPFGTRMSHSTTLWHLSSTWTKADSEDGVSSSNAERWLPRSKTLAPTEADEIGVGDGVGDEVWRRWWDRGAGVHVVEEAGGGGGRIGWRPHGGGGGEWTPAPGDESVRAAGDKSPQSAAAKRPCGLVVPACPCLLHVRGTSCARPCSRPLPVDRAHETLRDGPPAPRRSRLPGDFFEWQGSYIEST